MGLRRRPEEGEGWSTKKKIGIGVLVFFVIIIVAGALLPSGEKEEVTEPGEFVVSNLAISPSEVDPGQTVSVSVDVKNTGGEEGTKSLKLSVDGETKTESVILESNQSKTVFFKLSESKEGTYDVSISGMYGNFEVKVPAPAEFEVSNLTVSPSQVKVGERVTVSADVKNVGGEGGSYTVELRFAWGIDDTYEVTLNPGESTKVTFSFTVEEPGTYHPKIDNLSGSFEVSYTFAQIGTSYTGNDGLTVTLNGLTITEKTGSYQYTIDYTLTNNTSDQAIDEGSFKMYYKNKSGGLPQYGFFGKLFPGDTVTKTYTFEELKNKPFDVLEYHSNNFFSSEPLPDGIKWKVETP